MHDTHGSDGGDENNGDMPEHTVVSRLIGFSKDIQRHADSRSWQVLVKSGALVASLVLAINVTVLIVAYTRWTPKDDYFIIWAGHCDRAAQAVVVAHLIINILSSLLLAASNASMQSLGSPTRDEIDAAHSSMKSFTIGTPSVRNVRLVSYPKAAMWLVLGLSSLPLHLFWNSTVFQTLGAHNYFALTVQENFTYGSNWTLPTGATDADETFEIGNVEPVIARMQRQALDSSLERLERSECLKAYGRDILADRGSVLLVISRAGPNDFLADNSSLIAIYAAPYSSDDYYASSATHHSWMSDSSTTNSTTIPYLRRHPEEPWYPDPYPDYGHYRSYRLFSDLTPPMINYCLSEPAPSRCEVNLTPAFLITVCVCNAVKLVGFVWTLRLAPKNKTLVTQGDAIQSFLDKPDALLQGACLATKDDFTAAAYWMRIWTPDKGSGNWRLRPLESLYKLHDFANKSLPTDFRKYPRRPWSGALTGYHGWLSLLWVIAFLAATGKLFLDPLIRNNGSYIPLMSRSEMVQLSFSQGLGRPQSTFQKGSSRLSVSQAFLFANLPQIALSYLYVDMNNLLTNMLGMAEWTSYYAARQAKGLRVSTPVKGSDQTSTYFLTVPFVWGAPSVALFVVLHWLGSQMVYAAKLEAYNTDGARNPTMSSTAIYYSPFVALLVVILVSRTLVGLHTLANFKHFPPHAPLSGGCSASIAAACQPGTGAEVFEPALAERRLRWGVIKVPRHSERGHATFSDGAVGRIVLDMEYA